ncbi:MAG: hypothetical protein JXX28_05370 [Deltaproteobacteria bacterium]|nr:hypothetical protein [Deltaproteobacteria bacterium]
MGLMLLSLLTALAAAQEGSTTDGLAVVPPTVSYEWGLLVSYGTIPHFYPEAWAWPGLGLRGGGGYHVGASRFGGSIGAAVEGEVPVYYNLVLSPQLTWDHLGGRLQLGASLGTDMLLHGAKGLQDDSYAFTPAPAAALRIGWSEPWSVLSRRMFILVEPRVRWADGAIMPTGAVLIGSGRGR